MERRRFLRLMGAGTLGLAAPCRSAERAATAAPKPNILLIMSDEHNASVLGANGNRIVQTPALDRLATNGVSFDACYCNSPLCVPSRESFLSGKYVSRTGVWANSCELPSADIPAVPNLLNAAGYESLLCGKMHLAAGRRYGYADVGGDFNSHVKNGRGGRRDPDNLSDKRLSERFADFHTGDRSSILEHDTAVTKSAVELFRNRPADGKPFFLTLGYLAPHFPLIVPQKYWKTYENRVPMPTIPPAYLDALPLNYKHLRAGFRMTHVPEDVVKRGRELYYGLTQWLDEQIGCVLAALRASPFAADTVIVYTSDHGENMGEHGLWWKNAVFDTAARVPLIVSDPARWTGDTRRTGACSLVDLSRSLVELGGGNTPADWDGASLLPVLARADAPWRDLAISEYYAHNIASGYVMIRKGSLKYTYHTPADAHHPAERELYDLRGDPGELRNLAADPAHAATVASLHAALLAELREHPDQTELRARADLVKGYPLPVGRGKGKRKGNEEA